jgi:hypothetical protein
MTLLINIQINFFFKRKFPIGLTSKFGNLVWPNARAALVLSVSPMFYTGFESLNSVDGLWSRGHSRCLCYTDRSIWLACLRFTPQDGATRFQKFEQKKQHTLRKKGYNII